MECDGRMCYTPFSTASEAAPAQRGSVGAWLRGCDEWEKPRDGTALVPGLCVFGSIALQEARTRHSYGDLGSCRRMAIVSCKSVDWALLG